MFGKDTYIKSGTIIYTNSVKFSQCTKNAINLNSNSQYALSNDR